MIKSTIYCNKSYLLGVGAFLPIFLHQTGLSPDFWKDFLLIQLVRPFTELHIRNKDIFFLHTNRLQCIPTLGTPAVLACGRDTCGLRGESRSLSYALQPRLFKGHFTEGFGCLPSYYLRLTLIPSILFYFAYNSLHPDFLREHGWTRQELIISKSLSIMPSKFAPNLTPSLNITEDNYSGKLTLFCLLYRQLWFLIFFRF